MTCFVHFITAPWCFSSTCNPVQATQSRFPLSLHQLNSLRVLAIHWLHCRAGLTWSLFLTHPLSVFNHRLSCPACSAVGLVALSSHHCSPEVPEGLQKGCAFVHLFPLTAEVFVVTASCTPEVTPCAQTCSSAFLSPRGFLDIFPHHRECKASLICYPRC